MRAERSCRLLRVARVWLTVSIMLIASLISADDQTSTTVSVTRQVEGTRSTLTGRVLVTAADGGLLLETEDLQLVTIKPNELVDHMPKGETFAAWNGERLAAELQNEFGTDFEIVKTRRYVIVTNAGEPYARWCGELFERLQTAFFAYWRNARLELEPPPQPLVAILFASHDEYAAYAERDAGPGLAATQGYYSVRTNRIVLSNLAGSSTGTAATSEAEVLRGVEASIANLVTVVHEATHQIAFNTGMHTRYADNPMWLTEGMAMFFEAPDIRSTAGWKTIGKVHPGRLQQFQQYLASGRPANSLTTLIESEERFRDPDQIGEAYAESWALTHFLIRKHRGEYQEYLRMIAAKPRLVWSTPAQRIAEFQQAFGEDIDKLDAEFLRYMASLRVTR